ncbi:glutamate receptor 2.7 [Ricinus communis]|uniref:glutamate receptor 2.7 n=1 Tax=Ricinus communis TaxID=3988 RepID=UPI0007726284|nr:glutamate receptor 2.7 [Ricinus communis]|eukprot:XP_015572476.1 glutamate receptor 2.7 [Ricinus communis]
MRRSPFQPILFCVFLFIYSRLFLIQMVVAQNKTIQVNVGVVLDLEDWVGKMELSCINMALLDFYASYNHYQTRLVLNIRDSKRDVIGAAAAALDLIKNVEVQALIGPSTSMQAEFVIDLGEKAQVPIISYSASSPSLTSRQSSYFFRATQNDATQVNVIGAVFQAFGWRVAVPIYIDNEYGQGIIPYLTDALEAIDTRIPYRSVISPSATDDQIAKELYKLMSMQNRAFIVHMPPSLGSRLFTKAREVGMMREGYLWIMTDGMTNFLSSTAPSIIDSMQGVLGVRTYLPKTERLENFQIRWRRKFQEDNPGAVGADLNIYGQWAYDATIALAMAIEKSGTESLGFLKENVSSNSTDLETFGVSQDGPNLARRLSHISFKCLTGDFLFLNGQLQPSTFQIVNVNGNGVRGIGFWTPGKGLVKILNSTKSTSEYESSLAPIIWPGDSISVPKGREIPTYGKKLRIGVPVKDGFGKFVMTTREPTTNTTMVTGYCIDIFNAIVEALPDTLNYEYVPFGEPGGENAGSYDDLVYQVYLGNFDAVVGDVTIILNRSQYVDFTLPYKESGVNMIVPNEDNKNKNAWVFLKPLTWDLWATSFCFFIFIGLVIWILEHRINNDFRGPPSHQFSTSLYFSFSTMFFAQRERVFNCLAQIVLIVWCFVVLILIQSYTASLTSLLTVQQLLPTVTDVNQLIKNKENVGYKNGSFVRQVLKNLGFEETKLVAYNSFEECDQLLSKGSGNGGIAAAFDEVPYMKLFLAQYYSQYTMVEPITYRTDGFGFVFPIGSPLVAKVSRAILNVTEGPKMRAIEETWFGIQNNCQDVSTSISSPRLSVKSFWGLFLIAGLIAIISLAIFISIFIYEHWPSDSRDSGWSKIIYLLRIFDQRDLESHTFRTDRNTTNRPNNLHRFARRNRFTIWGT